MARPRIGDPAQHVNDIRGASYSGIVPDKEVTSQHVLSGVGITYGHDDSEAAWATRYVHRHIQDPADRELVLDALGITEVNP
jgi:hypothetical protein